MKETLQNLSQDAVHRLRKKGQERLTIMIIPHGQDKVFSLQLNWYLIIFCSAILSLLIFLSIYGIYESNVRKQELNRLNQLYGINFRSVLKLSEQSEIINEQNEILFENLEEISLVLGVDDKDLRILPDISVSRQQAKAALSEPIIDKSNLTKQITFLPPVYEIKTIQNQILNRAPVIESLKYFFQQGYGVMNKIPLGRPFVITEIMRDTSNYGARSDPFNHLRFEFHPGYDTRGPVGNVIQSTADGTVLKVLHTPFGGYGKAIIIKHDFGFYSLYAHLSRIHVQAGDLVQKNQLIGELGSTGRTTGPHIHYEIRYNHENNHIDPLSFMCALDYKTPKCKYFHNETDRSNKGYFLNL